ncbi:multicopper oxidase-domain-containing protein [Plectosphaerella plurivora]|uniref:Multicopper oxidase-domain-containing protein n=1 Tax=Plectosphaerella plurivora TaxID=936078 RepID=A0A9P8VNK9_9PEZI|nr:multicopper oxidase-domain-containing protein [Plectosphaerella plurivora]
MTLVERVWAVVTSFISIISLAPDFGWDNRQHPLQDVASILDDASLGGIVSMQPLGTPGKGPKFQPPGTPDDGKFRCEYPKMEGWEDCSHERDRKCWLRNKATGKQYDINTDYENEWPTGIERRYTLDLADGSWDADGLNFPFAKLFNQTYPGPWIQACWGDRLIVNVTNRLQFNGTSVHWHGIRQLNTTHMDGVNGITQCPIAPKDYFVYNFTLHQYGSSWYHSHYSVQYADGAAGPMTIHGPSSADWDEAVSPPLIMTDWYHNSASSVVSGGDSGGKDILLNGLGDITKFDNSIANTTEIKPPLTITFEKPRPGKGCKKYLLRVINTSFATTFVFSIDNHLLQVASADFVPIQPYHNTSILVGIGQRYNVIVEANPLDEQHPLDPDGNYWIRTQVAKCFGQQEGDPGYDQTGILRYDESSDKNPTTKKWHDVSTDCSDETYTSLNPILPWTVKAPSNGELQQAMGGNGYGQNFDVWRNAADKGRDYPLAVWTMDTTGQNTSMRVNYSEPIFLHLNPKDKIWPEPEQLWRVEQENYKDNEWIHLHGHDFAILEQASNKTWSPSTMDLKLNNPPRRDVVLLPTDGYVVIAFKADNPGPWLVHCHIAFHISEGLGMQIMENQAGAFKIWPDDDSAIIEAERVCDNWKKWHGNQTNWAVQPAAVGGKCKETNDEFCFQDDSGV